MSSAPEDFVQGRLRRNVFLGERSVWRLRETVFYENRDGFGSTSSADFAVREYGARTVYRRPLNREWLYGELIGGYTWPRESLDERREGSALVGFGLELLFGRNPY